jgi:hypothetical protein
LVLSAVLVLLFEADAANVVLRVRRRGHLVPRTIKPHERRLNDYDCLVGFADDIDSKFLVDSELSE